MDWLQFTVGMTSSLVWPLTLLITITVFFRPLKRRIGDISELSWGDKSAKFGRDLEKAISQGERTLPALKLSGPEEHKTQGAPSTKAGDEESLNRFKEIVEVAPPLAIVEAWLPIERELQKIASENGYRGSAGRSVTFILRRLKDDGVIDGALVRYIENLISLRNIAVHGQQAISVEEAQRYREAAEEALARLRTI